MCSGDMDDKAKHSSKKQCMKFTGPQNYCQKELEDQWVYGDISSTMRTFNSLEFYINTLAGFIGSCKKFFVSVLCNHLLPKCGFVNNRTELQRLCYSTCTDLNKKYCPTLQGVLELLLKENNQDSVVVLNKKTQEKFYQLANCSSFPKRNELNSLECYYPRALAGIWFSFSSEILPS